MPLPFSCRQRIVLIGPELFTFTSEYDWIAHAQEWYGVAGFGDKWAIYSTVAIDAMGRIATTGKHFSRAEREKAYPITVYSLEPGQISASEDPQPGIQHEPKA